MSVRKSVEWELAEETKVLGENLPQWQFFHHKYHMTWSELEPEPTRWEKNSTLNLRKSLSKKKKKNQHTNIIVTHTAFISCSSELLVLHQENFWSNETLCYFMLLYAAFSVERRDERRMMHGKRIFNF
jgi:hypothetical protein